MVKKLKRKWNWILFCLVFGVCNFFLNFDKAPGEGVELKVKSAEAAGKCCPPEGMSEVDDKVRLLAGGGCEYY